METTTPDTSVTKTAAEKGTPPNPAEVLQKMIGLLGIQAKVQQLPSDGSSVLLHIGTDDPGRLIGKGGQTLSQLQFLLNRMLQRMHSDSPHVVVDCESYREQQHEDTLKKAIEAAEKVRRWGEAASIGPLGALDRRVVQQHFDKDPELEAVSDNKEEGGRKKMIIRIRQKSAAGSRG